MTDDKRIAALEAEIDRLKASHPTPIDKAAEGEWRDRMREIAEQRASQGALSHYTHGQLRAMRAAAPDDVCKDIALRDCRAPTGPSSAGTSGQITKTSSNAGLIGSNSGWRNPVPIKKGLGQGR
jgi:hypothetical protein